MPALKWTLRRTKKIDRLQSVSHHSNTACEVAVTNEPFEHFSPAVVARTADENGELRSLQTPESNDHIKMVKCASDRSNIPAMDNAEQAKNDTRQINLVSIVNAKYWLTQTLQFQVVVLFQIGNNLIQRRNNVEFIAAELVATRDLNFGR